MDLIEAMPPGLYEIVLKEVGESEMHPELISGKYIAKLEPRTFDDIRALGCNDAMVLLHGGSPKRAELIASCWAYNRKVTQITFKPDWTRHAKAAPFKRNDQILETLPIGVIVFPGSGVSANLADKARKLGIPVWKFEDGGA